MKVTLVLLMMYLVLLIGGICLQVFLSKRANKWWGLILPSVSFAFSLLMLLNVAPLDMSMGQLVAMVGTTFLLSNIPTLVLLGIYVACRRKFKLRAQVDKMNLQDL